MEVWILLAAAGSGYLARRWQNSHKAKSSSPDDENDLIASSSQLPPSRGRYRHFSSGKQGGKLSCGKGNPHWARSLRTCQQGTTQKKEISKANAAEKAHIHGKIHVDLPSAQQESSANYSPEQDLIATGTCEEATYSADEHGPYLSRVRSGKRSSESNSSHGVSGNICREGVSGKRAKDAINSTLAQKEDSVFGETWVPCFWDTSEGVFVLDPDSSLVQHQGNTKDNDSYTRKIKTPRKYGRSRGSVSRHHSHSTQKPMSSLESCVSAQLSKDYTPYASLPFSASSSKHVTKHPRDSLQSHMFHQLGKAVEISFMPSECKMALTNIDCAVGLPSLSRQPPARKQKKANKRTSEKAFKVQAPYQRLSEREEHPAGSDSFCMKGLKGTSWKGLLFNFGVGVGMMFAILSKMHKVKRSTLVLEEAECLIKDLESDLGGKGSLRPFHDPVEIVAEMELAEKRQNMIIKTLDKIRNALLILKNTKACLVDEPTPAFGVPQMQSADMAKLEAELQAELERMEINVGDDALKIQSNNSGSCELEPDVAGSLVHGSLTTKGLPFEAEVETEDEGSESLHDDANVSTYAVSPRDLANRLHELLEARQEEKILELEAELNCMRGKLLAKEEELQLLRKKGSIIEDVHLTEQSFQSLKETTESEILGLKETQCLSSKHSLAGGMLTKNVTAADESESWKCSSLGRAALVGLKGDALAAYNEAYKEFSKAFTDSAALKVGMKEVTNGKDLDPMHSSDCWDQVDLVSLAEDLYPGEFSKELASFNDVSSKKKTFSRRRMRTKGTACHPEPENFGASSKGFDSSDEAPNDTSGSTPCSVKYMDVITVGVCGQFEGKNERKDEGQIPSLFEWQDEILIPAEASTLEHSDMNKGTAQLSSQSSEGNADTLKPIQGIVAQEKEDFSDFDDEVGQLLIKRIIEKSRKGSPIIKDAHNVLAFFE